MKMNVFLNRFVNLYKDPNDFCKDTITDPNTKEASMKCTSKN